MIEHPIRKLAINAWVDDTRSDEYRWLTKFAHGREFPICFNAATYAEAVAKAEAFRETTCAKHEAAYVARAEALRKSRAAAALSKSRRNGNQEATA